MAAVYRCVMTCSQPGACRLPREEDRPALVIHFETVLFPNNGFSAHESPLPGAGWPSMVLYYPHVK